MKIGNTDIEKLYVGGGEALAAYLGTVQVYSQAQPTGYIYYKSTDNNIVVPNVSTGFGANIVSNSYVGGGLCEIGFDGAVTAIPSHAFSGQTRLSDIIIPDSVTSFGTDAFRTCAALTTINYNGTKSQWNAITIPSGWADTSPLYLIKCSDDVIILQRDVPANELWYATTDATTTTGQGLSPIDNRYNSGIGKMKFVGNLTAIPDSAFSGNTKIVAVFVSSAVTIIGAYAFTNCPNLLCVSFAQKSASVTVKTRAFEASQKLLAIKMPKNISFYNGSVEYVFNTDTSLRYLDVPENLPQVIIGLFNRCYSLTKLHLPSTISNTIGTNSLRFDYSLMNLSFDGTTSAWNAKTKNSNWNRFVPATGITCTNGIATIDDSFTITGRTLNTNKSLIAITSAVSDVVDGYDSSVFMAVTGASNASVLFLSDNSVITSVGNRTFYQSSLLTELRLPPSLTTISQGFCDSCPNLYRLVYCGTMAQWKALWQNSTGSETAVVANCPNPKEVECKDGILPVEQA